MRGAAGCHGREVLEAPDAVDDLDDGADVLGRQALGAQRELLHALVGERGAQPVVGALLGVDEALLTPKNAAMPSTTRRLGDERCPPRRALRYASLME